MFLTFDHNNRMNRRIRIPNITILAGLLFILSIGFHNNANAQAGEALFKANCANCHKPDVKYTGPALKGWASRVPAGDWIYAWIANPAGTNDAYATKIKKEYAPTIMTGFPQLTNDEIDAIMKYVDDWAPPAAAVAAAGGGAGGADGTSDNSLLYGILALALAIVGFILLQVNSNLRKLSDEKEGIRRGEPVPVYRNKTYLMAGILLLFALGGYFMVNGAIGLGRMKNYQPEQPIYYSHTVHAGTNQINCLYCHSGAQDSKFSNIPSVNVCMNCHMAVKEYAGEKLVREDGTSVNGTAEIQKLYKYAGWNPETNQYNPDNNGDGVPDGAHPIEWVKIHNLPDHVYFNHSQHVKVGKQQCQTCHGNIQEMGEVKQFAELSMGWCINCHRESKVDMYNPADSTGNKFYSIYEKFYEQMSDSVIDKGGHKVLNPHKLDSITVEGIGGTECQKCHY